MGLVAAKGKIILYSDYNHFFNMLYTDIYGSKFFYHGWFWLDAVCKHCLLNSWWWHCGDVDNGVDVDDGGDGNDDDGVDVDDGGDEAQSSWEGIVSEGWNWAKPQLTQTAQILSPS